MEIIGTTLLGSQSVAGTGKPLYGFNATTGEQLEPAFNGAGAEQVAQACKLAWQAFDSYRTLPSTRRAAFLNAITEQIMALGDTLIQRAMSESGLPQARLEGERMRTASQLKLFADMIDGKDWSDLRIDPAMPDRQPPRADLRLGYVPLGPVAVFGASNFPLAFSVAGGDTASALAAGAPVVVKAHPAHPAILIMAD